MKIYAIFFSKIWAWQFWALEKGSQKIFFFVAGLILNIGLIDCFIFFFGIKEKTSLHQDTAGD